MVSVSEALMTLFPSATPIVDYLVIDDGAGQRIADWKLNEPQPTPEQLAAVTPEQVEAARVGKLVQYAAAQLVSTDPIPQAVRVLERVQQDHSNEQFRRIAAALQALGYTGDIPGPLLEADLFSRVEQYMQQGLSLPGPRPD